MKEQRILNIAKSLNHNASIASVNEQMIISILDDEYMLIDFDTTRIAEDAFLMLRSVGADVISVVLNTTSVYVGKTRNADMYPTMNSIIKILTNDLYSKVVEVTIHDKKHQYKVNTKDILNKLKDNKPTSVTTNQREVKSLAELINKAKEKPHMISEKDHYELLCKYFNDSKAKGAVFMFKHSDKKYLELLCHVFKANANPLSAVCKSASDPDSHSLVTHVVSTIDVKLMYDSNGLWLVCKVPDLGHYVVSLALPPGDLERLDLGVMRTVYPIVEAPTVVFFSDLLEGTAL